MKIILLQDVKGLGKAGDLVDVKPGYARNMILPKGLGIEGTKENLENWKKEQAQREADEKVRVAEATKLKEILESQGLTIKGKGGSQGRLFGSITAGDIAEEISKVHKVDVDRRKVELKEPIKAAGRYEVDVRVYPEMTAKVAVTVEV